MKIQNTQESNDGVIKDCETCFYFYESDMGGWYCEKDNLILFTHCGCKKYLRIGAKKDETLRN